MDSPASPGSVDRAAVVQTCRVLLRPIASLLLKCGMTWREFAEVSKSVFVAVASQDYGLNGRPTNVSRVSILTGVSRKEIARVRALLEQESEPLPNKTTDATRLLSGWHQDPEFLTPDGEPRVLPAEGDGRQFRQHSGSVTAATCRSPACARNSSGPGPSRPCRTARCARSAATSCPGASIPQWILNAGSMLRDLGSSITHNLDAGAEPTHGAW